MKKLGIYGGSFSPPHNGHVKSALAFYDSMELDELRILPAGVPPHKVLEGDATAADRLEMTRRAFSSKVCKSRNILVDDYEVRNEGKSFTYMTLEHFSAPDVRLYLLVGSDMFLSLETWKKPETIFALACVVVNRRETDGDPGTFEEKKEYFEKTFGAKVCMPRFKPIVLSSTDLRRQFSEGIPALRLAKLMNAGVLDYIIEAGLYGYTDACLDALRRQLPARAPKRVAHILSTEKEALRIAHLAGLSEKETFILRKAALLHDITHEASYEEQLGLFKKYRMDLSEADRNSPTILHQFTGACVARDVFDLEKEGCEAIACHTTGKPDMTMIDMILCLADYIEKTRAYPDCIALRRYFYDKAQSGVTRQLLSDCMRRYLESTVAHLTEKGCFIHPQTLETLAYFEKL